MEETVPAATAKLPDERVSHYWDCEGGLRAAYRQVLRINQPAWDVYLVYGRRAVWGDRPPSPSYWMHQLRGLPPGRRLDGDKLAAKTKRLLRADRPAVVTPLALSFGEEYA